METVIRNCKDSILFAPGCAFDVQKKHIVYSPKYLHDNEKTRQEIEFETEISRINEYEVKITSPKHCFATKIKLGLSLITFLSLSSFVVSQNIFHIVTFFNKIMSIAATTSMFPVIYYSSRLNEINEIKKNVIRRNMIGKRIEEDLDEEKIEMIKEINRDYEVKYLTEKIIKEDNKLSNIYEKLEPTYLKQIENIKQEKAMVKSLKR